MLVYPTDSRLWLLEPRDLLSGVWPDEVRPHLSRLDEVINWVRSYLCAPHPELGRDGPVCPYTEQSLDRGLLWVAVCSGVEPTFEGASETLRRYRDWFVELEPVTATDAEYKAILVLFPTLKSQEGFALIERIQAFLKPEFVERGLMIGQFHSSCEEPGVWNPGFRPLRSPLPLLAIRQMVRSDAPFLMKDRHSLSMYLQRFGRNIPSRVEEALRTAAIALGIPYPAEPGMSSCPNKRSELFDVRNHHETIEMSKTREALLPGPR